VGFRDVGPGKRPKACSGRERFSDQKKWTGTEREAEREEGGQSNLSEIYPGWGKGVGVGKAPGIDGLKVPAIDGELPKETPSPQIQISRAPTLSGLPGGGQNRMGKKKVGGGSFAKKTSTKK